MELNFTNIKGIKKINTQNVLDLFNSKEYSTEVLFKKEQINGKSVIKGIISSVKNNDKPDDLDENNHYYSNNQKDKYLPGSEMKEDKIQRNIFFFILIILLLIELVKYIYYINSDNRIEMTLCKKEWESNKCESVSIEDGPHLNNFCKDKEKCINKSDYVFLIQIILKIAGEILELITSNYKILVFIVIIVYIIIRR